MIKVNPTARTVRETTAPYLYEEKGEAKTADIRVRYFSFTWNELQSQHAALKQIAKNGDATIWPHETLVDRIESLPDLAGPDGKKFAITAENLGCLDTRNLEAIQKAINEDFEGKARPAKSPNG